LLTKILRKVPKSGRQGCITALIKIVKGESQSTGPHGGQRIRGCTGEGGGEDLGNMVGVIRRKGLEFPSNMGIGDE